MAKFKVLHWYFTVRIRGNHETLQSGRGSSLRKQYLWISQVQVKSVTTCANLFTDIILHIQLVQQLGYRLNDSENGVQFHVYFLLQKA
jgi:hypothetical protein